MSSISLSSIGQCSKKHKRAPKAIAFIDGTIEKADYLTQGIEYESIVIHAIPVDQDGVNYITTSLLTFPENNRIYLVAQGEPGTLFLGNTMLSLETLNRYSWDIQGWFSPRAHLTQSALILHSCNVAVGERGADFLFQLRQLCGVAIVAPSRSADHAKRAEAWTLAKDTQAMGDVIPFRPRVGTC